MKKVLVVVDMQKDFLEPDGKLAISKDNTELKQRVANRIREFDGEVICTLDTHFEDSVEFSQFPSHCVEYTEGHKLSDEINDAFLGIEDGRIFQKYSFAGGGLTEELVEFLNQGYEFEFAGVCTHICVHDSIAAFYHSAKERVEKLPKITVRKELVGDFDDEMADNALKRMERLYGVKVI